MTEARPRADDFARLRASPDNRPINRAMYQERTCRRVFAVHHSLEAQTPTTWIVHFAGYVVTAVGVLLMLFNLCDGLRSLARRQHPMVLRLAMVFAYLGLSVRLVHVFMLFRLPS